MMDLYTILEVDREATLEQLKAALRKQSKEHHPDKGGDEQLYKEILLAFEILADPIKRKRYDETGSTDARPDNSESQFREMLHQLVHGAIAFMLEKNMNPEQENMIAMMVDQAKGQERGLKEKIKATEKKKKILLGVAKRFKRKNKNAPNILKQVVEQPLQEIEQTLARFQGLLDTTKEILVLLNDSEFDFEKAVKTYGKINLQGIEIKFESAWGHDWGCK